MQEGIIIQNQQLPDKIEDLAKFVLVGREKLTSVRAEIRAIDKLELAEEVREQKKEEAQMLAEALIDAEVRIGDLLKQIPTASGKRTDLQPKDTDVHRLEDKSDTNVEFNKRETKKEVIERLGFTQKQAQRFEILANNKEIVEQVKAEARENDDVPNRSTVLQLVKEKTKEEQDNEFLKEQFKEIERVKGTEIRMNDAIFKILTVEVNEENVQIWINGLEEYRKNNLIEQLDEIIEKYKFIKEVWLKTNQIRRIK